MPVWAGKRNEVTKVVIWRLLPVVLLMSYATNDPGQTVTQETQPHDYRIVNIVDMPLNPSSKPTGEQPAVKEFRRGDTWGSILETGGWQISTPVTHTRLRCATFETGIQLGQGDPDCSDVRWLTNAEFGTRQIHCNSATLVHRGGGDSAAVGGAFEASSCVRVVTRCTGPC
jgi:hypothetical protein